MSAPTTYSQKSIDLRLDVGELARHATRVARDLHRRRLFGVFGLEGAIHSVLAALRAVETSSREIDILVALTHFARKTNHVAHYLPEHERGPVFELKGTAVSELILRKAAIVNNISVDGTVGLDLLLLPGKKLHCPLALLVPPARAVAKQQAAHVPVSAPILERVNSVQLEGLRALVGLAA